MLKNRAQIALESIKNPIECYGVYVAVTWSIRDSVFRARNVRHAHNLFVPQNGNPGSAPGSHILYNFCICSNHGNVSEILGDTALIMFIF